MPAVRTAGINPAARCIRTLTVKKLSENCQNGTETQVFSSVFGVFG
jgi:hypothetical protein